MYCIVVCVRFFLLLDWGIIVGLLVIFVKLRRRGMYERIRIDEYG